MDEDDVMLKLGLTMLNSPEWGRLEKQIFGPGQEYHWSADWTFGTM